MSTCEHMQSGCIPVDDINDACSVVQEQNSLAYDHINALTLDPRRVDPFTRTVLAQLSAPVSRFALVGQATFRAIAITDDNGIGSWAGESVGWFFNHYKYVPRVIIHSMVRGAISQAGFREEDVDIEDDTKEENDDG